MTSFTHFYEEDKPLLIYIGDPMCSWCYGISEDLNKVVDSYQGKIKSQVIVGGLRPGGGDEWNEKFTEFLRHHWKDVEERSGAKFGYNLLDQEHFFYDTEPSCRAVVVVKNLAYDKSFEFFSEVQKKFYYDNEDPKEVSFYKSICGKLDISYTEFSRMFDSEEMKLATARDFQDAKNMGVTSFPTVVLKYKGDYHMVSKGYSDAETMTRVIERIMAD